jgi:hypothetical protein
LAVDINTKISTVTLNHVEDCHLDPDIPTDGFPTGILRESPMGTRVEASGRQNKNHIDHVGWFPLSKTTYKLGIIASHCFARAKITSSIMFMATAHSLGAL